MKSEQLAKFKDISSKCRLSLHTFSEVSSEHSDRAGILSQLDVPFSLSEIPNLNVKPRIKKEKKIDNKNVSMY